MALEDWIWMIDTLLGWLQDWTAAIKLREGRGNISCAYRWYGVIAWHELGVSAKDVRNEILAERVRAKECQDSTTAAIMREGRSCYPERWEPDHRLCFSCRNAVKEPYPENYPWCRVRIETGQSADEETCRKTAIAASPAPQANNERRTMPVIKTELITRTLVDSRKV